MHAIRAVVAASLGLLLASDTLRASVLEELEKERVALFENVADGVVLIRCGDKGFGSGFIVSADGLIITNRHVIDCDEKVTALLRSGEKKKATVVEKDALYDLALLKIDTRNLTLKVLVLADSDLVKVGDYAASVGHPVGGVWTMTDGMVSNRYPARNDQYAGVLQMQVPVQPGSSGGPVFNRLGKVVGITTAKLRSGDATAFCIQSNLARRLLQQYQDSSNGQLAVSGNMPGAQLVIDGAVHGGIPALVTLPPGAHKVEVLLQGRLFRKEVSLAKGEVTQLFVKAADLK